MKRKYLEVEKQEVSHIEVQVNYWKTFVHALFFSTLRQTIISTFVFTLTFVVAAYHIYNLSIKPQHYYWLIKLFGITILFLLYIVIGTSLGLFYGISSSLLKKIEELKNGIQLLINPLMTLIIEKIPGHHKNMTIDEFNVFLDKQINWFKSESLSIRFRFLSLVGMFSRFFIRMTLRALRYILLNDFLEDLKDKGEEEINIKNIESYYRENLLSELTDAYAGKLKIIQYSIYIGLIFFLLIPAALLINF